MTPCTWLQRLCSAAGSLSLSSLPRGTSPSKGRRREKGLRRFGLNDNGHLWPTRTNSPSSARFISESRRAFHPRGGRPLSLAELSPAPPPAALCGELHRLPLPVRLPRVRPGLGDRLLRVVDGRSRRPDVHRRERSPWNVGAQHARPEGRGAEHHGPVLGGAPPALRRQLFDRPRPFILLADVVPPGHRLSGDARVLRADRRARGGIPGGEMRRGVPTLGGPCAGGDPHYAHVEEADG